MEATKTYALARRKHRQGDVVQRFGDFKKNIPQVLIPLKEWYALGSPDQVTVVVQVS